MNQGGGLKCCAVCNQQTHRRCARCLIVYYCNTEHQREDWKRHKSECSSNTSKSGEHSTVNVEAAKKEKEEKSKIIINTKQEEKKEDVVLNLSGRRQRKFKSKKANKEGSSQNVTQTTVTPQNVDQSAKSSSSGSSDSSVISSVLSANKDSRTEGAITYEGSSENEILTENAQQLSSVDFYAANARTIEKTSVKMPVLPERPARPPREYPEASLQGSPAPFTHSANSYYLDPNDPFYTLCQRVIRDMTQYGVCVLDNFIGKERGQLVLNEVLSMYNTGIFRAGQLVSNPKTTEVQTIRSDLITWIDGKEPHCFHIGQLMAKVDNIILRANKMANNGRMGDFLINGRTKGMVACYPGSGAHYVKHVDNPNKDGRCITAIYYLNMDWDVKRCGGLLRVFPANNDNKVADIEPIFDRMLFFWSDRRNPHEVQPAYSTRYAITLWYFDAQERAEARKNLGLDSLALASGSSLPFVSRPDTIKRMQPSPSK